MSLAICSRMEPSKVARCRFPASTGEEDIVGMETLADFSTNPKLKPTKNEETTLNDISVVHESLSPACYDLNRNYFSCTIAHCSCSCSPATMHCLRLLIFITEQIYNWSEVSHSAEVTFNPGLQENLNYSRGLRFICVQR